MTDQPNNDTHTPGPMPCPFCGNVGELEIGLGSPDKEGRPYYIFCPQCGCVGPWIYGTDVEIQQNEDIVANLTGWNDRPSAVSAAEGDALGEAIELLREAVDRLRVLEKFELTMCNGPGETRDDSISKFSLGMTRRTLSNLNDFLTSLPTTDAATRQED